MESSSLSNSFIQKYVLSTVSVYGSLQSPGNQVVSNNIYFLILRHTLAKSTHMYMMMNDGKFSWGKKVTGEYNRLAWAFTGAGKDLLEDVRFARHVNI